MTISLAWFLACAGRPSIHPIWDGNSPVSRCRCPALSAAHHWLAAAGLAPSGSIARSNDPASRSAPASCEAAAGLAPANFPSSASLAVICLSTSSATVSARATRSATSPAAADGASASSETGPGPPSSGGAGSADTLPSAPMVSLLRAARFSASRSTDCASPIPLAASRSNDAMAAAYSPVTDSCLARLLRLALAASAAIPVHSPAPNSGPITSLCSAVTWLPARPPSICHSPAALSSRSGCADRNAATSTMDPRRRPAVNPLAWRRSPGRAPPGRSPPRHTYQPTWPASASGRHG